MIHFSVDDTIDVFRYLAENNCETIFENPILKYFKGLNNEYKFIVSMYCFFEDDNFNLEMCPSRYREEFRANADWLMFGFHGLNKKSKYADYDAEIFMDEVNKTIKELKRIVSNEALTYDIRLGFCQGNKECIKAMKERYADFNMLFGADDDRIAYFLTEEENKHYLNDGEYYVKEIGITVKKCEKRLEYSADFAEAVKKVSLDTVNSFFTHEYCLKDKKIFDYIKSMCESGHVFVA